MARKHLDRSETGGLAQTREIKALRRDLEAFPAISAFVQTILDDPDAAAVFTTLGISTFVQTILDDVDAATVRATISAQQSDATLTALAAYNTNGLLTQTAADTFAGRTIAGTANQIALANGDGVAGNPTVSAVIASQGEAEAGTDTTKLMTAQRVAQAIAALATVPDASVTVKGKVELATNAETVTGTDTARATTPAGVAAALATYTPIPSTSVFPVGTLALMKTTNVGTVADGATIAGTNLRSVFIENDSTPISANGAIQTGTWTNVSGMTAAQGEVGYFLRTA